jgi:hypothetical protein
MTLYNTVSQTVWEWTTVDKLPGRKSRRASVIINILICKTLNISQCQLTSHTRPYYTLGNDCYNGSCLCKINHAEWLDPNRPLITFLQLIDLHHCISINYYRKLTNWSSNWFVIWQFIPIQFLTSLTFNL